MAFQLRKGRRLAGQTGTHGALKLESIDPLHGCGIAHRNEKASGNIYPPHLHGHYCPAFGISARRYSGAPSLLLQEDDSDVTRTGLCIDVKPKLPTNRLVGDLRGFPDEDL
jgi:hypothetical protein